MPIFNISNRQNNTDIKYPIAIKLIDDVAGDQSGLLVPYTEIYLMDEAGNMGSPVAILAEDGTPHTLQGVRRTELEVGQESKTVVELHTLNGSSWTPSVLTQEFTFNAATIAGNSTFTDSRGVVTTLIPGFSATIPVDEDTFNFNTTNIEITADTGDIIYVIETKLN